MNHKTILVTGASRGIGKAIALTYARNGWDVVITCLRREEELKKTQREIEALGVSCLAWMGDAGDFESCSRLFDAIRERFGSLDVLVNNAGISYIGLFQDMTPDEWNHILNTNLTSVFNCCRLAIPMMVSRKSGRILNISSVWGIYAMTRALAKELAPSSIQVNAIACGAIDTEMNQFLDEEERNALLEEIPAGRMGRAEEVGKLAYQLGSEDSYLTGQIIQLDGGWI